MILYPSTQLKSLLKREIFLNFQKHLQIKIAFFVSFFGMVLSFVRLMMRDSRACNIYLTLNLDR